MKVDDLFNGKIPAPLFEDPIYGAPTDPVIIRNEEEQCWWLLYTQRRPSIADVGYSGVHGTNIGIASSKDLTKWLYRGTIPNLDIEPGHNTFWAPEVIRVEGTYHMYVSYITGIPVDWNSTRQILHYSAKNLWHWKFENIVHLSSDRVIDACIYETTAGKYKMWYKDEGNNSHTYAAESQDLYKWVVIGEEINDCPHEGPNVFELAGKKWMITDCWDGLAVYRSDDFIHWKRHGENILKDKGKRKGDNGRGHHADVLSNGNRAFIFYFVHPNEYAATTFEFQKGRTVIQAAELTVIDDDLICNRNVGIYQ
jgi:hypothetical protein